MIKHTVKKLPSNTFEIIIEISWDEIEKEYKTAFDLILAEFSFEGFRKGKVPSQIAQKHIPKDQVYSQLIRTLLPRIYEEIIKKEGLKPIVSPKIDLVKAKEKETWQIKATLAEKPTVDLGEYRKKLLDIKAGMKKDDIWVPGKDEAKKEDQAAKNDKILDIMRLSLEEHLPEEETNACIWRIKNIAKRVFQQSQVDFIDCPSKFYSDCVTMSS